MEKFKKLFGAQDMTVGNPSSVILRFAIPLLIGNIIQQLYSTVDAIIVGKYVGDNALAAIGAANPLVNLLLCLFMGISVGASIVVAQYFGAKNRERLSHSIGNIVTLTFLAGLFIITFGLTIASPMLKFLATPEDIIQDSTWYLCILLIGFLGNAYYNILSGVLRGMGDSVVPLLFLMVTCGMNIVLDVVFVALCGWGVAGAAVATILSQCTSATLCFIRLRNMGDVFDFTKDHLKLDSSLVKHIVKIGAPAGATQAIFACAAIVVQALTNSFGTMVIATSTVVMRVDGFAMLPNFTFNGAMTTYVGQNVGAGKADRVAESAKHGLKLSLMFCVPMVTILMIFGGNLMSIFTDTQEVVTFGMQMLRMMSIGYVAVAITQVFSGVMRGAGDTFTPMVVSILSTVLIRMPVAYALAYITVSDTYPIGNPSCIFYSLMISWVSGAVITLIAYKRGKWKKKCGLFDNV